MQPDLRTFLSHLAGAVAIGLAIPIVAAFLSLPYSLGFQSGETAAVGQRSWHMT